jgi:hypothetical protein
MLPVILGCKHCGQELVVLREEEKKSIINKEYYPVHDNCKGILSRFSYAKILRHLSHEIGRSVSFNWPSALRLDQQLRFCSPLRGRMGQLDSSVMRLYVLP